MKLQRIKSFALAATFAMAFAFPGKSGNLPVPDDCRIIDSICYKFDASTKTALVSTYMTEAAYRGKPWNDYFDYDGRNLIIPPTITIDSEEYTVVGFDNPIRNEMGTSRIDTVDIPSTIEVIPFYLFRDASVKTVFLHEGLKTIGGGAFKGQKGLTGIELPEGLEIIGDEAFMASGLKAIRLPNSLKQLGWNIFSDCQDLEEAVLPQGILEIPAGLFRYSSITSIILPAGVQKICSGAFTGSKLQSIEFPKSLREIESFAFSSTPLSSIKFNDGVETIDWRAFSDMNGDGLTITLPYNLKTIGQEAFLDSQVKEVIIQKNVQSIGENAFKGCPIEKVISLIEQPRYTPLPFQAFDDNVFLYKPLYVPTGLVEEYRRVIYWNKFYDIFEMDMSPLERVTMDNGTQRYYTIDGKELAAPEKGLFIIQKDGKSQKILKIRH